MVVRSLPAYIPCRLRSGGENRLQHASAQPQVACILTRTAVSLNTITSAGAFPTCRSFHFFRALLCLWCCPVHDGNAPSLRASSKKSPAYAVQIHLIPGHNQVGAIVESLGFPVVPGHAHPFPGTAPNNFCSRGTSVNCHGQSRGLLVSYLNYIYQKQEKMARIK